ncbi:hypothetical protein N0V93_006592 [Gnomoniopsis smithogilvyi]|uniref:Uncharacterized protein n=1 Tax=Gnomoniopsis smithogilvyi TaxID=1191159 RepID=A0A9W8YS65_9PEZI|nr:hypothetical protein N0V93_006592 [Gnomoniopsis smithogilvyi]
MSARNSPSPSTGAPTDGDESNLPQGNCRYIMMMPEIKGHRCACVNFSLNKSLPGATCECGHLACFHHKTAEQPMDRQELDLLRQRVQQLEELLSRGSEKENEVIQRVSELEGVVEVRTEEISQEIKKTYGNLNRAWHSIGELERRSGEWGPRFQGVGTHLKRVDDELRRLHDRQCELNDADLSLEERVLEIAEQVEDLEADDSAVRGRRRRRGTSLSSDPTPTITWKVNGYPSTIKNGADQRHDSCHTESAIKGLHQMVVVNGTTSEAFVSAVSTAFQSLLRNRPWVPLQAKLCDAETLQGLPMLRPLDPSLIHGNFDVEFLRAHCAVLDAHGKIDSLYISMQHHTLSWHALRHAPVFLTGLEASWEYDPMLDANDPFEDDDHTIDDFRPSAGDLVGSFPNLKRAASEISRSSSFGAATGEAATASASATSSSAERRPKVARTPLPLSNIHEVGRRQRVETA